MLNKTNLMIGIAALVFCIVIFMASSSGQNPKDRPHFQHSNLTITRSDGKTFPFSVEVAETQQDQAYGLMFIQSLPENSGMIFPYDPPREIAFWMKNTLIPLDMLFVRPDHTIGRIVANARPQDLTPIPSEEPVSAVIEVNGGVAHKNDLAVGDKVSFPEIP